MKITWQHARSLGYCGKGIAAFCRRFGFDIDVAKTSGIDEAELRATNDIMAIRIIERVRQCLKL